ncbi:MAG: hypothetical protein IID44_10555 [Planctomycetes bacterium]|nr:hypothetical protein [Planctomycetota bacterium]
MDESFDPYLQWLGIRDAQRPPNHYRLLGVAQLESDTDVISNAADRQMAHVRTFQTGKHSDVSQRVLNELAKAKVCLLNPAKKAAYDKQLSAKLAASQTGEVPATAKPALAAAAPAIDADQGRFAGVAVQPTQPYPRSVADRAGRRSSKKTNTPLLLAAGIALFGIGVIIAVIVAVNANRSNATSTVRNEAGESEEKPEEPEANTPSIPPIETNGSPSNDPKQPNDDVVPPVPTVPWPFSPHQQEIPPERKAPPLKLSEAVLKSLRAAREAMRQRDIDKADEHIEAAAKAAESTAEQGEVDRHRDILFAYRSFWNAVDAGLTSAGADQMLAYRNTEVTIVSVDGGRLKLKAENGAERSFDTDRKKIDFDLARAVAQDQLDKMGPAGLVAIGAAIAMDRPGDIRQAEDLWRQAGRQGTVIAHFVSEFAFDFSKLEADAIVELPVARKRVPASFDLSAAAKKIPKLFGTPIRQIKTPEQFRQARTRAAEMLVEAENPKNSDAIRYKLFEQGIKLLVRVGDLAEALRAIEDFANTFQIDRVVQTKLAMKSMAEAALARVRRRVEFDPKAATVLLEAMSKFAYEAAVAGKHDEAREVNAAALRLANVLEKDVPHKPLANRSKRFAAFSKALRSLRENDDNPRGHLTVGEFQSYFMGDWQRGLKHLAKGSDKQLSELARDDLAGPTDAEAQLALGDRWWKIHNKPGKSPLVERIGIGRRTKHWYEASPGLGNDVNARGRDSSLKQLANEIEQLGIVPSKGLDLLALPITKEGGDWRPQGGALLCIRTNRKVYPRIRFSVRPVGAYQLDIEFERMALKAKEWPGYLIVCLPTPGSYTALTVNCGDKSSNYNGLDPSDEKGDDRLGGKPFNPVIERKHHLIVKVTPIEKGESVRIEATVDGKPVASWQGPSTTLKGTSDQHKVSDTRMIGVGAASGGIKFYKVIFTGSYKAGK